MLRLRAVHRRVGLLQEVDAVVAERDADARPKRELVSRRRDRRRDLLQQPFGDNRRLGRLGHGREQHGELVAADARDRVAGAKQGLQPLAEDREHLVADAVPVLVVDLLELVDVDVHERGLLPRLLPHGHRVRELLVEERAVREPGQGVVERLQAELRLRFALRGDVEQVALQVCRLAVVVENDDALIADPDDAAVAREQPVLDAQRLVRAMCARMRLDDTVTILGME